MTFYAVAVAVLACIALAKSDAVDKWLSKRYRPFRRRRYTRKLYEFKAKFGYAPRYVDMRGYLAQIGESYLQL